MEISIKKVSLSDLEQLQQISRTTFEETFASSNSEDNMNQYLNEGFANEKLISELSNPSSEFYFAKLQEEIIGYLKINFGDAQTELQNQHSMEIERIYVLSAFHGKKVGQLLYDFAVQLAKEHLVEYIWLGVWEENHRAIGFYKKNGFVEFDKHVFMLGDDAQTDIMMRKQL